MTTFANFLVTSWDLLLILVRFTRFLDHMQQKIAAAAHHHCCYTFKCFFYFYICVFGV